MGWASGSSLFMEVWSTVQDRIPECHHLEIATDLMRVFRGYDCDTLDECLDEYPELEQAYEDSKKSLVPTDELLEDEEEEEDDI